MLDEHDRPVAGATVWHCGVWGALEGALRIVEARELPYAGIGKAILA